MLELSPGERRLFGEIRAQYLQAGGEERWFDTLRDDARFFYSELEGNVAGKSVLEIGCGSGMALTILSLRKNVRRLIGIEPMAAGFNRMEGLQRIILGQAHRLGLKFEIAPASIEQFEPRERFDFIYSYNVFEHLPDWRRGLDKALDLLKPDGSMMILCPNYDVPYESHFNLPLVLNKKVTGRLFGRKILRFEAENNCQGLWQSLNCIKFTDLSDHLARRRCDIAFDKGILARLFRRFNGDATFGDRHKWSRVRVVRRILGRLRLDF